MYSSRVIVNDYDKIDWMGGTCNTHEGIRNGHKILLVNLNRIYEGVSKSFRTGRLEREL
jgi:hypothetical protein